MSSKQKTAPHESESPKSLKMGSRVRCTDDGVQGRLVWANALSVKIRWDDGEQVTWRRDSLADRPLEILDPEADEPASPPDAPVPTPAPERPAEPATTEPPPVEDTELLTPPLLPDPAAEPAAAELVAVEPTPEQEPATEPPAAEQAPEVPASAPPVAEQPEASQPAKTRKHRQRKEPKATEGGKEKKLSALDAAAQVLSQASGPMNCQELIEAMAIQGLWSSPAGKTPVATLYTAVTMLPKCAPRGGISKRAR